MAAGISIIVCCYNSEKRIAETIRHLCKQQVPSDLSWEVIVINNASLDNTARVASDSWSDAKANALFRIVDELTPGLSAARQKGVAVANYDTLIFCDDDNHLDPSYVHYANQLLRERPEVGILGGWAKPKLPDTTGEWIEDFYPALAIGRQAEQDGYVNWVFGAGMILKKEIFATLHDRSIKLMLSDRLGSKQTSGGDSEICMAARFVGYKIYYSSKLVLHHQIAPHRLKWKSFVKANYFMVFPVLYIHLMNRLLKDPKVQASGAYWNFVGGCLSRIFYFLPRCVLGKHKLYSCIMLFQSVQLIGWLMTRKTRFHATLALIQNNLYNGQK